VQRVGGQHLKGNVPAAVKKKGRDFKKFCLNFKKKITQLHLLIEIQTCSFSPHQKKTNGEKKEEEDTKNWVRSAAPG
jgi:hypothetical protein